MANTNEKKTADKLKKNNFNLRNDVDRVTGVPMILFDKCIIEIVITGPQQIQKLVYLKKDDGSKGKQLQWAEMMKMSRATGFVTASTKADNRGELTEKTRAMFFNLNLDPAKIKEPKVFAQSMQTEITNLEKTKSKIKLDDTLAGKRAYYFATEMAARAGEVLQAKLDIRAAGNEYNEKETMIAYGFPASLKSKFLTGCIEVPTGSTFASALYGAEIEKFSALSVDEVLRFSKEKLKIFCDNDDAEVAKLLAAVNKTKVADWVGLPGKLLTDIEPKKLEHILTFMLPIHIPLGKLDVLRHYERKKKSPSRLDTERAQCRPLAELYNTIVSKCYYAPPANLPDVKTFWEGLSGGVLRDPNLVSKSFRTQTIELLANAAPDEFKEQAEIDRMRSVNVIKNGKFLINAFSVVVSGVNPEGVPVILNAGYSAYQPSQIVSSQAGKKKKAQRFNTKQNNLTKKSLLYMKGLRKHGVSADVVQEAQDYLESFLYLNFQEMAAHIIYVTCKASVKVAMVEIYGLDPDKLDEDGNELEPEDENLPLAGVEEDESEVEDEADAEALPAIIEQK